MQIYNQGREIELAKLEQLARAQNVRAWLIGEFHHEKNGATFQREVINFLKPSILLTEGKTCFEDTDNCFTPEKARKYLAEWGDINPCSFLELAVEANVNLINCDRLSPEEIKRIEANALLLRYGTSNLDEIASKHYGLPIPLKDYTAEGAKRYCNDTYLVTQNASCMARDEVMAKYIAENLGTVANPAVGIFGADHLCLRKPNILIHPPLRSYPVLVLNPLKIQNRLPLDINVLSYDAVILGPTSSEESQVN
ncbi:hypothetical protein KA107_01345 [Candidatus Pacearchaeota archaeon]|nr:hypothetical protein [Candidatus Pacearchaeota archaeon]